MTVSSASPPDRACTRADPPSPTQHAVPRSSSFTRSRRFVTGKGLSARECFGVVDDTTTRHVFDAARMQLMHMLPPLSTAPSPAPPPPPPPTAAVSSCAPRGASSRVPPPPPPPPPTRAAANIEASSAAAAASACAPPRSSHASRVRLPHSTPRVCSNTRFSTVADATKWFESLNLEHKRTELSASSAVSDNNKTSQPNCTGNHVMQRICSADECSSLESANESALKRAATVANMPDSESVTPCSSDAPLSPYVPAVLDAHHGGVCARAFLEHAHAAECDTAARRDSHVAYVAHVVAAAQRQQAASAHHAGCSTDRDTAAIAPTHRKPSGLQRFNALSHSLKQRLPRGGSFTRVTRSRSFGRVGRLRSFGRKEEQPQQPQQPQQQPLQRGSISTTSRAHWRAEPTSDNHSDGESGSTMTRSKSAPATQRWRRAPAGARARCDSTARARSPSRASTADSRLPRVKSVHFADDDDDDAPQGATSPPARAQRPQHDDMVTIERRIRRTHADGRVELLTRRVRVRAERVLGNGDVIVKRRVTRQRAEGGGTELMTVRQLISKKGAHAAQRDGEQRVLPERAEWVRRSSSLPHVSHALDKALDERAAASRAHAADEGERARALSYAEAETVRAADAVEHARGAAKQRSAKHSWARRGNALRAWLRMPRARGAHGSGVA
eukprot:TRINITY_DN4467_c0_g1_i1.p1 TRINITY_DN4467_c0_g1~~TRINITY_DN4467_c0_g1_i1.p1  ORF type:complete len:692 (-),score=177.99 TRINITY_DN4467_c0_g1_i1:420-2438(-)